MGKWVVAALAIAGLLLVGCSSKQRPTMRGDSTVLIVNGADGPGPWYRSLSKGLVEGQAADHVESVNWGAPWAVLMNLSFGPLHRTAEARLLDRIAEHQEKRGGRLTLVGHSAGCGVILKALEQLPEGRQVDEVMLLAACVGERYDLAKAMPHVRGGMHVFHSDRDALLLKFSTRLTGTYEHAWSEAAGLNGFARAEELSPILRARLHQYEYDPKWKALGHRGGHFGYRSTPFAKTVLAPIAAGENERLAAIPNDVPTGP